MTSIQQVLHAYHKWGSRVHSILADFGFESKTNALADKVIASRNKHVSESERYIRTIKEKQGHLPNPNLSRNCLPNSWQRVYNVIF